MYRICIHKSWRGSKKRSTLFVLAIYIESKHGAHSNPESGGVLFLDPPRGLAKNRRYIYIYTYSVYNIFSVCIDIYKNRCTHTYICICV